MNREQKENLIKGREASFVCSRFVMCFVWKYIEMNERPRETFTPFRDCFPN